MIVLVGQAPALPPHEADEVVGMALVLDTEWQTTFAHLRQDVATIELGIMLAQPDTDPDTIVWFCERRPTLAEYHE